MTHLYNNPREHGLTLVADVDIAGGYAFDTVLVYRRDSDGKLFWSADSGCSCPTPFDFLQDVSDLEPLPETVSALESHVNHWPVNDKRAVLSAAGII